MSVEIDQQIAALRDRIDLIWAAHEREHKAHEEAHAREHQFAQKAIDTAAELARENKAASNEWRSAMNDRERTFSTKVDIANVIDKVTTLERAEIKRVEMERQRADTDSEERRQAERRVMRSQWTIGIIVGLLASAGAILINFALRSA